MEAATPVLVGALEDAVRAGSRLRQLQIFALWAWQQLQLGSESVATALLARAASLAAATGYIRVLFDIPALAQLQTELDVPPNTAPAEPLPGGLTKGLTGQELQVLRLLATEYTYTQIAAELVISLNTVRTYVSSIYRKLGVHRRDQAVAVARSTGYLPA